MNDIQPKKTKHTTTTQNQPGHITPTTGICNLNTPTMKSTAHSGTPLWSMAQLPQPTNRHTHSPIIDSRQPVIHIKQHIASTSTPTTQHAPLTSLMQKHTTHQMTRFNTSLSNLYAYTEITHTSPSTSPNPSAKIHFKTHYSYNNLSNTQCTFNV